MKLSAIWVICPYVKSNGEQYHEYLDYCSMCAPYWHEYPTCPICKLKLAESGYCKGCRHYYDNTK